MRHPDVRRIGRVRPLLLRWYRKHERDLIWRTISDPYAILVSEVMLQQTQVARVQEKFPLFLKRFPTVRSLARAPRREVLHAWQGMGYNNRAVRLHELASIILKNYHGRIPETVDELLALPGIGKYTAHAFLCFAHGKSIPVVDVNIQRVYSRVFWKMPHAGAMKSEEFIWEVAERLVQRDASRWNQAVMDLGATICIARNPGCHLCPLHTVCRSANLPAAKMNGIRKRPEPSHAGIPRRIWRGRIVERLRTIHHRGAIPLRQLGKAIKSDFRSTEILWLTDLVRALERDGLVTLHRTSRSATVTLAD